MSFKKSNGIFVSLLVLVADLVNLILKLRVGVVVGLNINIAIEPSVLKLLDVIQGLLHHMDVPVGSL